MYLLIKSYKGIQIKGHQKICLFLRISIDLLRSALFIPLIEIYFTVIVCDREYFTENVKCWKSEHLTYFILCLISFLLFFYLSYMFTSVSFNKKEKFSSSVSKYLIINADLVLILSRAVDVILLELCVVTDLNNITIIFFLFSSLFSAYCIFKERKYQWYKNNIAISVKYIFNIFFFVNCLMLLISNLIKMKKFIGMFNIFMVISVVVIIYICSTSVKHFNILKRPLKKEKEIYNNIRIIIQLIKNKKKNRYHLLKLLSYSFNLTHGEQLTKIKNLTPLRKIVELYNNQIKEEESSKLDYYFYQYIEGLYKDALKTFRDSPLLLVNYAIFQLEKMHRYHKAYIILLKCMGLSNINFSEEFFIYRIKRNLEEKGVELGKEQSYISYTYQINNMLSLISEVSYSYSQLYGILLNNTKIMDIHHLKEIAIKIDNLNNKIHEGYNIIESSGFNSKKVSIFYDNFLKDILHDTSNVSKYLNEDLDEGIKIDSYFFDINSLNTKSDFQFLIASGENQNFGSIIKISLELCELLGYSDKDILGQNINIFIPNILRIPHENLLREKVHNTTPMEENFHQKLKIIPVCLRTSSKFLVPVNLEVGIYYDENNQALLFSKLVNSNSKYSNKCVVIINSSLIIQIFSANAIYLLGLDSNVMNSNVEILTFFQEFYSDCLNYLSSISVKKSKDILSLKIKLIKEYFFNDSENKIITWKNHKKFKVEWKELKIKQKIYGYSIFFELDEGNGIDRENFIETIFSPRKPKRNNSNLSNMSRTKEIFPVITKSYIPQIEEKINFDIHEKTYTMKKDSEKTETIKEFFENKYKDLIEDKKIKNISSKKENDSSNYESVESSGYDDKSSNDYSLYSNADEEEEKEEEEEEKKSNKDKQIVKEIIIENTNDNFYEVNLKKIYLQIYDFKNNNIKDCKDYIIQSKMHQIFHDEQEITKRKLVKKFSENIEKNKSNTNDNNLKLSLIHPKTEPSYNSISNTVIEKIITKIISPKLINRNILYYLCFYIFQFICLIIMIIILYDSLIRHRAEIYALFQTIYNQCNIIGHMGLIHFYTFEYIILKNPHYSNFYQLNRTLYRKSIIQFLNFLYTKCMDEVSEFDYNENNFDEKNKQRLIDLKGTFIVYHERNDFQIESQSVILSPDNAIKEYLFSLFKSLIDEEKNLHFLNININFIHINTDSLSDILLTKAEIYIDCMISLIDHIKKLSWIIFSIHIVICIISCILCLSTKTKIIKEKEKYLGMFYKIDTEILRIMLLKCEKYTKIQINKDNPVNTNNIFEIGQDDNEIDSLIEPKENEYSNYTKDKFNNDIIKKKNLKKNDKILNNIEFKKALILETSFLIILTTIILVLILLLNNSYKNYQISSDVNYKIIEEGRYIYLALNYIKSTIIHSGIFSLHPKRLEQFVDLIPSFSKNYSKIKEIELNIHLTSIKYKLPGNTSNILNTYSSESYCKFFYNFSKLNNISCENFAYNISNFGLPSIQAYYFNSIIQSSFLIINLTKECINNGYAFYDQFYGTPLYVDSTNDEKISSKNPYFLLNNDGIKNSNIILTTLFYPMFEYIIITLRENITKYDKSLKDLIIIFTILLNAIVFLTYIIFIFPIILSENKDLNKTKIVLRVIPKIVLFEIIKNEYLNEADGIK